MKKKIDRKKLLFARFIKAAKKNQIFFFFRYLKHDIWFNLDEFAFKKNLKSRVFFRRLFNNFIKKIKLYDVRLKRELFRAAALNCNKKVLYKYLYFKRNKFVNREISLLLLNTKFCNAGFVIYNNLDYDLGEHLREYVSFGQKKFNKYIKNLVLHNRFNY